MALHATFASHIALHKGRVFPNRGRSTTPSKQRETHDLALGFWSLAMPACLLFWAAVAYAIHSLF